MQMTRNLAPERVVSKTRRRPKALDQLSLSRVDRKVHKLRQSSDT